MTDNFEIQLDQFKLTYFEECYELLAEAEALLSGLSEHPDQSTPDQLNGIFRAVHSIKGGAGAFGFAQLVKFAHVFENLLDKVRSNLVVVSQEVADTLLRASDVLATLVNAAQLGEVADESIWIDAETALKALSGEPTEMISEPATAAGTNQISGDVSSTDRAPIEPDFKGENARFQIIFTPHPALFRHANEPLLLIRELKALGDLTISLDSRHLPELRDLNPEDAVLCWTFNLVTDASVERVEEVFEFAETDCDLSVSVARSVLKTDGPDEEKGWGVFDKASGAATAGEGIEWGLFGDIGAPEELKQRALAADSDDGEGIDWGLFVTSQVIAAQGKTNNYKPVTHAVHPENLVKNNQVMASTSSAQRPANVKRLGPGLSGGMHSIRVELDRLDRLVNMVGELVITQAMLCQQASNLPLDHARHLQKGFEDLNMHTRDLQDSVMAIRMQPVKSIFQRMPRLVRELAANLDKSVELRISGENTEVDKTVIETLADPLTHMIRNSLDHGIEMPEQRREAGKPEKAIIHLSAEHRSGRIQIEVFDDGQGIDRARILAKARERGLIGADEVLTDEETDELIFAPGLTTAREVSEVSGRGVGMDVVRRNIQSLGGRVSVQSVPGRGSRFIISLPLTLAVLDGMIVAVGGEKYVVPLTSIAESLRPDPIDVSFLSNGTQVINLRGQYIRLIGLADYFDIQNAERDPCKGIVVITEVEENVFVGLVVDELQGQQQVVIKSLEENYDPVLGISAATILGNGRVALILDILGLYNMDTFNRRASEHEMRAIAGLQAPLAITEQKI